VSTPRRGAAAVLLRPMERAEAPAAAAVLIDARQAAARAALMPWPLHPAADVEQWFVEVVAAQREVWVGEVSSRLVAVLVLDTEFLDHLYVLPDYAVGGIGTSLVELAKALRPRGFGLWVFAANTAARALYESMGMVAVEHGDGSGNEEGAADVRYAWRPR